jgi:hypothetical protein
VLLRFKERLVRLAMEKTTEADTKKHMVRTPV